MNVSDYFSHENFTKIKREILEWLPSKIIDGHVHTATEVRPSKYRLLKKSLISGSMIRKGMYARKSVFKRIFPGKKIRMVGFPLPSKKLQIDPAFVNSLIIKEMRKGLFGCMLASEDVSVLENAINEAKENKVRFHGIKFHPWIFSEDRNSSCLNNYFSQKILEFCEKNKLTMICELPKAWNKKDTGKLKEVLNEYEIKAVVPHLGFNNRGFVMKFSSFKRNLNAPCSYFRKQFENARGIKNLYLDTALITDGRIIRAGFEVFGEDRILWGDDHPYSFTQKIEEVRFPKTVLGENLVKIVNNKPNEVSEVWRYYFNVYQQIHVIKRFADKLPGKLSESFAKKVFFNNAIKIYNLQRYTKPLELE